MNNNFEKFKKMSITKFKDFLLDMRGTGVGCGNCILRNKYCNTLKGISCEDNILNWLKRKEILTADEMFEELGYKKKNMSDTAFCYNKEYDYKVVKIHVVYCDNGIFYAKFSRPYFGKDKLIDERINWESITEAEDKAIHKKIEELKNG